MSDSPDRAPQPEAEYQARLERRQSALAELGKRTEWIANARLALFVLGLGVAYAVFGRAGWSAWWLALVVGLFALLVVASGRATRAADRARHAVAHYERGLARLRGSWAGGGDGGDRFLDAEHPYAADLDLFGSGSLYELINVARTRSGEEILARWLLAPADLGEIAARQGAVAELRDKLDFREELALGGGDVRAGVDPEALASWGQAPRQLDRRATPWVAGVVSLLATAALVGWLAGWLPASVFFAATLLVLACHALHRKRIAAVVGAVEKHALDLELLAELLERLEREPFASPRLQSVRQALDVEGLPPSVQIRRLGRLVTVLSGMRNQFFAPFGVLWLWPLQFAWQIDRWRVAGGPGIARWLAAVGEFEAFASLGAYAYENPRDPFPELVAGPPRFEAEGLGHPLLSAAEMVRNDLLLDTEPRVLVVSGSNMSGKSTLLRAVGVNAVLAQAGAPVRARRLALTRLSVGGTLRVQDSLQAGKSRFYAEITRVRQLVEIARGPVPLLFLLDEIFSGTNSHERCHGAEAIVRGLINANAIGLVTTHDLTLAEIAERLAPAAKNVHFEDQFEDGQLSFDYRMRGGIVRKSNALALMRAIGLEV